MPDFDQAFLNRDRIKYVCSFDPAIDWEKSRCTRKEYIADPGKHFVDLFLMSEPILFWLQAPTSEQTMVAYGRAGMDLAKEDKSKPKVEGDDDDKVGLVAPRLQRELGEGMGLITASIRSSKVLFELCCLSIENFTHWPTNGELTHFTDGAGMRRLTPVIAGKVQDPIQVEIGRFLAAQSNLDEAKKKPSGSPGGGATPSMSTPTPTTATSAESPKKPEQPGAVTDPPSPTPTAVDNSTTSGLLEG